MWWRFNCHLTSLIFLLGTGVPVGLVVMQVSSNVGYWVLMVKRCHDSNGIVGIILPVSHS